jgi:hypothetical protein
MELQKYAFILELGLAWLVNKTASVKNCQYCFNLLKAASATICIYGIIVNRAKNKRPQWPKRLRPRMREVVTGLQQQQQNRHR